jgi:hypothetical protein
MKTKLFTSLVLIAGIALATLLIWVKAEPVAAAQTSETSIAGLEATYQTYLPLTVKNADNDGGDDDDGGGGGGGGSGDAGALWLPFTISGDTVLSTYGTSVAVDSNGGIHAAYAIYSGTDAQGNKPAIYAYCAAQCADKNNWSTAHFGEDVQEVRLVLDPNNRPRLMLYGPVYDPVWPRMRYQYAACNSGCTNAANWSITTLATPIEPTATREYDNNHYFALDGQGRPALIYTDTTQNDHPGTFYLSCQTNCSNINQWTETLLTDGALFDKPSLAFSPSGQPRLAFGYFDENSDLYLFYAQCDANCTDGANWSGTTLVQIHGTAMYSLRVDSSGRPRMGVFTGSYAYDPFQPQKLYYLWCNSGCTGAQNWYLTDTQMPYGSGDGVDLALDAHNRPRMSFQMAGEGLGYAWCDTNCETGDGSWESLEAEPQQALADDYEVLPIHRCTVSTWLNGQRTSLALDQSGNPRIGYDAQHWWYGTEVVNGVPQTCNYQDVTVTRFTLFNQP